MEVFQRIKNIREDKDIQQKTIAELFKTTQPQYSKYERGIQEIPIRHIITLSKFYGVSADYLLCLTDNPTPIKDLEKIIKRLKEEIETLKQISS